MRKSNKNSTEVRVEVMGIDLGDRFSNYASLDARGAIVEEGRIPTMREALMKLLSARSPMRVVIETGTHSPWVSRVVAEAGHECVVANARKVRLITANKRKRDKVDALLLARLGRADANLLHPIRHRSQQTQLHRTWLLARDAAVRSRTQLINHMRGIAKSLGERLPASGADAFATKVAASLPPMLAPVLAPLLPMVAQLTDTIHQYDRELSALARQHYPVVDRLEQVKGVGPITALAYVLTLEDPSRFRRSRTVGAYLGLVPAIHESGEQEPQMHITKEGDVMLRRLLVSAAQYILGRFGPDCDLRRHGQKIAARGGKTAKKRAVVAVARKLAVLLHKLWNDQVDYEPFYSTRRGNVAA